jgi:uncharacterized membrane protein
MKPVKRVFLWLLGAFYLFAGLMHFWRPDFYMQIMPPYLPAHRALVEFSGVAEFALGLVMLTLGVRIPRLRRWTAWGIVALLVAVFPANVYAAQNDIGGVGIVSWIRLPFQAVFIGWAWLYTRPDPSDG